MQELIRVFKRDPNELENLDVHKKVVVAAIIVKQEDGSWLEKKRTLGTMAADLLGLSDWLLMHGVTHVAMESTGEYWKPVFNIQENNFEVMVVNAQHISKVPGRKTDQGDAQWIAELLQYGLMKASFVPPMGQWELRELTRDRSSFVRERATLVNRVQKVLESANIKLASVAADLMGVSGRAMLAALIAGKASPEEMSELAKGRMRENRDADRKEPCKELGSDYFDKRNVEATAKRLTQRLERLGFQVSLQQQLLGLLPKLNGYFHNRIASIIARLITSSQV